MEKNNTTSQVFVGSTSIEEDSFYDMFEFNYDLDNEPSSSPFTILMGINFFDEDDLMIEYKKHSSLMAFIDYISSVMKVEIPENIVKLYTDIDFIITIDTTFFEKAIPEKNEFESKFISIKYLGEFEKIWVD